MRDSRLRQALAAAALCLAASAPACALTITPTPTAGVDLFPPSANMEKSYVESFFSTSGITRYYKADYNKDTNGADEEDTSFRASYDTVFAQVSDDVSGAVISYAGGAAISCPQCYLAVKDGNNFPSYYFFNLGTWSGTETITLQNFWPGPGSISHIAIWGKQDSTTHVPEPGSIALLAAGLAGLATLRRRRKG